MINFPEPLLKKSVWVEIPIRMWAEIDKITRAKGITQEQVVNTFLTAGFDQYKNVDERPDITTADNQKITILGVDKSLERVGFEKITPKNYTGQLNEPGPKLNVERYEEIISDVESELSTLSGRSRTKEENDKFLALYARKYYYQRKLKKLGLEPNSLKTDKDGNQEPEKRKWSPNTRLQPKEIPPTEFEYCANPKCPKPHGKHVKGTGIKQGKMIFCSGNCKMS